MVKRAAFTLVELLVVMGVIAVLISLLMPVMAKVRLQAKQAACMSNLRQIDIALVSYQNEYDGYLPTVMTPSGVTVGSGWINILAARHYLSATNTNHYKGRDVFFCPADRQTPLYMQGYSATAADITSEVQYSSYKAFSACWRSYNSASETWAAGAPVNSFLWTIAVGSTPIGLKASQIPNGSPNNGPRTSSYTILSSNHNPPMVIERTNYGAMGDNNMWSNVGSYNYGASQGNLAYITAPHPHNMRSILYYDNHIEVGYVALYDPHYASVPGQYQFTFPH